MAASLAVTSGQGWCRKNDGRSIRHPVVRFSRSTLSVAAACRGETQAQRKEPSSSASVGRREVILRSSEMAVLAAIFHFSGTRPNYLGVQKNPPSLALCPATKNCITTTEELNDPAHFAPPWNYNPENGRGRKNPVTREVAMAELLQVIESTRPDNFTPHVTEKKDDYVRVEYESPIFGFVDDVEFWFPPGKKSVVEYRSASRLGSYDFDANRKRIKVCSLKLLHQ
ncbi:hypothetical protein EJ110_NYTH16813 [Nymphaea thermarum]|nr:hypothetical protein EJ110_NYTH16813 [Nymphaea thermarum]